MSRKVNRLRPINGGKMWPHKIDARSEEHQAMVKKAAESFKPTYPTGTPANPVNSFEEAKKVANTSSNHSWEELKKEEENKPSILYDDDVHILGVDKNHIFNKYEPSTWKPGMVIKESPNSNYEVTLGTRRTNNSGWYSSLGDFFSDTGLKEFNWRVTDWKDVKWD